MVENRANIFERLKWLLGEFGKENPSFELKETTILNYSWEGGYERLSITHTDRKGGMHFNGMHHPNDECKTEDGEFPGICIYCGSTIW